jgi:hypothetical protein
MLNPVLSVEKTNEFLFQTLPVVPLGYLNIQEDLMRMYNLPFDRGDWLLILGKEHAQNSVFQSIISLKCIGALESLTARDPDPLIAKRKLALSLCKVSRMSLPEKAKSTNCGRKSNLNFVNQKACYRKTFFSVVRRSGPHGFATGTLDNVRKQWCSGR